MSFKEILSSFENKSLKILELKKENEFFDYEYKKSDLFILIVCHFDTANKSFFDKEWKISSGLSRYQSKTECWKENIDICFKNYLKKSSLLKFDFNFSNPYSTFYKFYLLSRNPN